MLYRLLVGILIGSGLWGCHTPTSSLRTSGTIEATEIRIGSQVPGQVIQVSAEEGTEVQAGDTLAIVDHEPIHLQLEQAKATLEASQAELALLRKGARPEDIAQAKAQLKQAKAQLKQAQRDLNRLRELLTRNSATAHQVEQAALQVTLAESRVEIARQNVHKLLHWVRPEELRAAEARIKQVQSTIALLQRQLRDAFIRAPRSGFITEKMVEPGELVAQGRPLFVLADLRNVYLRIYIPEGDLGKITLGQSVNVFTDSYPDRPFKGQITYIAQEAEFTPKNVQTQKERVKLVYEVHITIPNPDLLLKPGMYADAVISTP